MEHFLLIRLMFWAAMFVFVILLALVILVAKMVSSWIKSLKRKRDERGPERGVLDGPSVDALDQVAA